MAKQIGRIQRFLNEKGIDALMIRSAAMKRWMDTMTGSGCTVLVTRKRGYLIADGRYTTEAAEKEHDLEIVKIVQRDPYLNAVKRIMEQDGCASLGVESSETLASLYLAMKDMGFRVMLLEDEIAGLRIIKDDDELELIQKAADLGDRIYASVLGKLHAGMTEFEISALLQYEAISSGAQGMAFETIVSSGERTALPHGRPTARRIRAHEPIMMDFGVRLNRYESDMTRVCFLGEPDPAIRNIYHVVQQAQQAGVDAIRAGATGMSVDRAARDVISDAGYGQYFVHGLGHGIGVDDSTEGPILNARSTTVLQNHMVMSCEPGIYVPGVGGIRIEDMVQIVDGVGIPMTHTDKNIRVLEGASYGI